ncbi:MAG: hypothetical protein QOE90_2504 [Thermoplasmata archaeon]|jgi:uncharacterized protein YbjT (DUF2867 family)|nr:hypothetical protein [Thermoplasmata archaeon]
MTASDSQGPVLVAGATGNLGSRVVNALLARGKRVRALVRAGTEAGALEARGVEIARGDLTRPETLPAALRGVDAVVTTAIGYSMRKPGDSIEAVDIKGNRSLVDAAHAAGVRRFVFTSILTADQAPSVPHFWAKKLTEDHLAASGVPAVSLRPGAYLGGSPWWTQQLAGGAILAFGPPDVAWTYVHPDEVADLLAQAVDARGVEGRKIDVGSDRPVTLRELARLVSAEAGREIRLAEPDAAMQRWGGDDAAGEARRRDMTAMARYFGSGKYVADTRLQREVFGHVPTIEETVRRAVAEAAQKTARPTPR